MEKVHWWSTGNAQNRLLNDAADALGDLRKEQADADQQIDRLFQLDRDQGREIARLQAVVTVLVDMLIETGTTPEAEIMRRMDRAVQKVDESE